MIVPLFVSCPTCVKMKESISEQEFSKQRLSFRHRLVKLGIRELRLASRHRSKPSVIALDPRFYMLKQKYSDQTEYFQNWIQLTFWTRQKNNICAVINSSFDGRVIFLKCNILSADRDWIHLIHVVLIFARGTQFLTSCTKPHKEKKPIFKRKRFLSGSIVFSVSVDPN